ncbi:helix-turn-helix domain-containing protein [Candidatus Methylospira mobilis]|uniref:helix-turn-helix domain-containing protein n=1 Tax=Candidatus Methylospira mobilis TaxID=1808979 RepID=UPI001D170354|nr:helix-turn-helix domain-containing protein [Candidatus Methylospira mobilis]WNV04148.1 helix-turn-helix domain-containing protein [Candidatus Methylospira mobilis]
MKAAKQRGAKLGRKPALSEEQRKHASELLDRRESPAAVAKLLKLCRATLYNSMKKEQTPPPDQLTTLVDLGGGGIEQNASGRGFQRGNSQEDFLNTAGSCAHLIAFKLRTAQEFVCAAMPLSDQ